MWAPTTSRRECPITSIKIITIITIKGRAVGWFYVLLDTASITTNRPVDPAVALPSNGDPFVVFFFFLLF